MKIFNKILISNRGEIALRIIRTVKQMGIRSCVVYAQNEKNSWFVQEADEAYSLGEGTLSETYLNTFKIIEIAVQNNIDAIHPGYGFLSENADFAESCVKNGIVFIGPSAESIRLMGNKVEALKFVSEINIPLLKSIVVQNGNELLEKRENLPYPIIIKAAAGGGGKGMRIVQTQDTLSENIDSARREALSYFGDSQVFIEQYIESSRHIEVQILGDSFGNIVHLFDRECTIQRRHQKIIEEAPSPTLSDELRSKLVISAVGIAKAMGYTSAGTIEFLLDEKGNYYFLEMNTRIQVEHPVTEELTGIDIVKEQIRIAQELPLSFSQDNIKITGHAIECRVYAEDAFGDFLPSSGNIHLYCLPEQNDIRVDSSINCASEIYSDYDPMIAKFISHGGSRFEAINKLKSFLSESIIQGINTNIDYLREILVHPKYIDNDLSTQFCKTQKESLFSNYQKRISSVNTNELFGLLLLFLFTVNSGDSNNSCIWNQISHWRLSMNAEFEFGGTKYKVAFRKHGHNQLLFSVNNNSFQKISGCRKGNEVFMNYSEQKLFAFISYMNNTLYCSYNGLNLEIIRTDLIALNENAGKFTLERSNDKVYAPINGRIVSVHVKSQDKVNKGDVLMVIESMKMENNILAPHEGFINQIMVNVGDRVSGKEIVAILS